MENTKHPSLSQVALLAPGVAALLDSRHCRLTASVTSHDVTGGYGRGFTFHLKLEMLLEQCLSCFETPQTQPNFDCKWHCFERRFMQVADSEASTLEAALGKLEAAMTIRDRTVQ